MSIGNAAAGEIEADLVVLAHDLGEPAGGLADVELAVDEHLLELVGQDYRGVAVRRDVAGRYFQCEAFIGTVAKLLHDLASLGAVILDIRVIARERLLDLRWHSPDAFRQG